MIPIPLSFSPWWERRLSLAVVAESCCDGSAAGAKGPNGDSYALPSYDGDYTVASTTHGHLKIHANFTFDLYGKNTKVSLEVPVREKKPEPTEWSKVGDHFSMCAYWSANPSR